MSKNPVQKITTAKQPVRTETIIRAIKKSEKEPPQWYVLKTKPRAEKKLDDRLKEAGIETYLPLKEEIRQWSDRKKKVILPMLPGYLFIFTTSKNFVDALQTDGAVHFLKFAGKHAVMQEEQIEFIRKVEADSLRFEVTELEAEPGDLVEITDGQFKGMRGYWVQKKTKYNVHINVEQLHRTIKMEVPVAFLRKVDEGK